MTGIQVRCRTCAKFTVFGNFQMISVRYQGYEHLVGDGDEYLWGMPDEFELGRRLKRHRSAKPEKQAINP